MKCQPSPLYAKDNAKNITVYCEYCNKIYEDKECTAKPRLCTCGSKLGTTDYACGKCLNCNKKIN